MKCSKNINSLAQPKTIYIISCSRLASVKQMKEYLAIYQMSGETYNTNSKSNRLISQDRANCQFIYSVLNHNHDRIKDLFIR